MRSAFFILYKACSGAGPRAAAKPVAAAKKVAVEFVADCPLATTVSVAGSFNKIKHV